MNLPIENILNICIKYIKNKPKFKQFLIVGIKLARMIFRQFLFTRLLCACYCVVGFPLLEANSF